MSGINGEQAAEAFAAECTADEEERCAKFLARFVLKPEIVEEPVVQ